MGLIGDCVGAAARFLKDPFLVPDFHTSKIDCGVLCQKLIAVFYPYSYNANLSHTVKTTKPQSQADSNPTFFFYDLR